MSSNKWYLKNKPIGKSEYDVIQILSVENCKKKFGSPISHPTSVTLSPEQAEPNA